MTCAYQILHSTIGKIQPLLEVALVAEKAFLLVDLLFLKEVGGSFNEGPLYDAYLDFNHLL